MFFGFSNQPKRRAQSTVRSRAKPRSNQNFIPQGIGIMTGFNSRPVRRKEKTWHQAKRSNPSLNPFGDSDGDGVINWKDCRPHNKNKQGVYFHGTTSMSSWEIEREGLKPSKDLQNPHVENMATSTKTEKDKVFMFKKPHNAQTYAKLTVQQRGNLGRPIVMAVDVPDNELEEDKKMVEFGSGDAFKKKGMVSPEKVKVFEGNLSRPGDEPIYNYGTPNYVVTDADKALLDDDEDEEEEYEDY